ncbi:hypothetical protein HRR84_003791 [Exophiala dermatitidis]|nr:hypothetical protein HRR84_003791 [Exophiala dermatitidis]
MDNSPVHGCQWRLTAYFKDGGSVQHDILEAVICVHCSVPCLSQPPVASGAEPPPPLASPRLHTAPTLYILPNDSVTCRREKQPPCSAPTLTSRAPVFYFELKAPSYLRAEP